MYRFFLIAGERSGDNIGAGLIKELNNLYPESQFQGVGGSAMIEAGLNNLVDINKMSIIGYWQVIKNFFTFKRLFNQIIDLILEKKPDIIITIDSPGLNYRLAKKLRLMGYTGKIIHYVAPTVWAYKPERANKFSKIFDGLICILPFEPPYFEKAGLKCQYVGHPLVEKYNISEKKNNSENMEYILVTPGSRKQEVDYLMPVFIPVLDRISKENNIKIKFLTTKNCFSLLVDHLNKVNFDYDICDDQQDKVSLLRNAKIVISKSGTITLDIALANSVQVMCYKIDFFTALIARFLLKGQFFALPNIILGKKIVTELIQDKLNIDSLYQEVDNLLKNNDLIQQQKKAILSIANILGASETDTPSKKAAKFISQFLK